MHLARPKATWALTLPLMFFASCMDAGPTEPPSAGELYGASEVGDAFDRFFLNSPEDDSLGFVDGLEPFESLLTSLAVGQCMIEYAIPDGKYLRFRRTVAEPGLGALRPFAIAVQNPVGAVRYRGSCNVQEVDVAAALKAISWAPENGLKGTGRGWGGHSITLPSRGGAVTPGMEQTMALPPVARSVNWDLYDHYDYCYVLFEGSEPIAVLSCGYNEGPGDECTIMESQVPDAGIDMLARSTTECVDPAGGGGGGSGGEGDPPDEEVLVRPEEVDEEFWNRLTATEKKYCYKHILECIAIGPGTVALILDPFGTYYSGLTSSAEVNAVRHCTWSAWLHSVIGSDEAWGWLAAHEAESDDPVDTQIDWSNNQRGRELFQQVGLLSLVNANQYCRQMLADGYLDLGSG